MVRSYSCIGHLGGEMSMDNDNSNAEDVEEEYEDVEEEYDPAEAEARIRYVLESRDTSLDLSGCRLHAVPPEVFGMTWLVDLNLQDNLLTDIPDDIALLRELQSLELWNNKGVQLGDSIGELT